MKEIINKAQVFMEHNPHYGYLLAAFVLMVFSIGNFKKWDWAVSPSGSRQRSFYKLIGEKNFSKVMGTIFLVGSIACFFGFYLSNN